GREGDLAGHRIALGRRQDRHRAGGRRGGHVGGRGRGAGRDRRGRRLGGGRRGRGIVVAVLAFAAGGKSEGERGGKQGHGDRTHGWHSFPMVRPGAQW